MSKLKDIATELLNAGGINAVDKYFDENLKMVPWEWCYECDMHTPRDLEALTLKCLLEDNHEE